MILIYDISDRDKNPFLATWVNRASAPPYTHRPPSPIVHDKQNLAEIDNNDINVCPLPQIFVPSTGSGCMLRQLI